MGEQFDTPTNDIILSSSGVAALVAALAETLCKYDESFPAALKTNARRLYDLLEKTDINADVSEAIETLRILLEYLDLLEKERQKTKDRGGSA